MEKLKQEKPRLPDLLLIKPLLSKVTDIQVYLTEDIHRSESCIFLPSTHVYHVQYSHLPNMSHYAHPAMLDIILLQYKCIIGEVIALQTALNSSVFP
jgi:hypothetical protein